MRRLAPVLWLTLACGGSSGQPSSNEAPVAKAPAPTPAHEGATAPVPVAPEPPAPDDGPGIGLGDIAPTFSLPDDSGKEISLDQYRDQRAVLLAFYPQDFTGG